MQKAQFPMKHLRITQDENGSTSHKGSLAMDLGGKDTGVDAVYAPCDMRIVRVRQDSSHETYAESVEPVEWADGTVDYMNFTFMHDDVINPGVKAGAVIRQGQHFFDEGGYGGGRPGKFAAHLHLEVGRGKSPAKQVQNAQGTFVTPGQVHIYDALFLPADCIVLNGGGHSWKRANENNKGDGGMTNGGMTIGVYGKSDKPVSSALLKEGAIALMGKNGKLEVYTRRIARPVDDNTLSPQYEALRDKEMQAGEIIAVVD